MTNINYLGRLDFHFIMHISCNANDNGSVLPVHVFVSRGLEYTHKVSMFGC